MSREMSMARASSEPSNRWSKRCYGKTGAFSDEAERILDLIAECGSLRVPFDDSEPATVVRQGNYPEFVYRHRDWKFPERLIVSAEVLDELLVSGILRLLTRKRYLQKIGWEEAGLDGRNAEFWCLVQ